jgi:uncharacterized membrane protein YeaQ/YmgE (transglycosylase-associated protein family)
VQSCLIRYRKRRETIINTWFALGIVLGLLAWKVGGGHDKTQLIEDVLVGVFGAVIGGEILVPAVVGQTRAADGLHFSTLALGLGVAIVALLALHTFRRRMLNGRSRKRRSRA